MRPPYSQPAYTAHSRISADSGGSFIANAIGSRMATPLIGPRPGSSPTTVPMKQPISNEPTVKPSPPSLSAKAAFNPGCVPLTAPLS